MGNYAITEWTDDGPQYADRQLAAERRLFGKLSYTRESKPLPES
ncbi:hypothetical protein [Kribbella speibonae]|nr:hypothetical protein [Kribbella speibonae]